MNIRKPFCINLATILLFVAAFAFSAESQAQTYIQIKKGTPLSEQMVYPSATYEIRSKIDLHGDRVIMPKGCTVYFKKGLIKNGELVLNHTRLDGKVRLDCRVSGSIQNDTVYTEWFFKGAHSRKKVQDKSERVQMTFNLGAPTVAFGTGYYRFQGIDIGKRVSIVGSGTIVKPAVLDQTEYDFHFLRNVFYSENAESVIISGFRFEGYLSGTILSSFKSDTIYGEPLIWVNKGQNVEVSHCVFANIENCTYCNKAYTYYGKKQGSCVCLWDVSNAVYTDCEQTGNRHDEQIWVIAVDKPIADTRVTYARNYIHDMKPGPNSSAFTCVAGECLLEENVVENYSYPGSMFNTFAKKLIIKDNKISHSYCSSVFDACEYRYFHNDEIIVENNNVEAINSILLLAQSEKVSILNNDFRGLGLYSSANSRIAAKSAGKYKYWYTDDGDVLPTDAKTVISGNQADFTNYDGTRSIAGTKADYGTGEILEPSKYSNVGSNYGCGILVHPIDAKAGDITIKDNVFTSIQSLDGIIDKNNLADIIPEAIRLINTDKATITGNTFHGAFRSHQSSDTYSCISIYSYPDVMEKLSSPKSYTRNPTQLGVYTIENNTFNVGDASSFSVITIYPRRDAPGRRLLSFTELNINGNTLSTTSSAANAIHAATKAAVAEMKLYINTAPISIERCNINVK